MDLWIRSQDKEILVKVEYLEYFYKKMHYANEEKPREEHHNIGTYISNEQFIILGEYKTEQRALEVLDEIQSFLENNYISIDEMPSHSNSPYPGYYPTHISTMYRKKVFKMPKE